MARRRGWWRVGRNHQEKMIAVRKLFAVVSMAVVVVAVVLAADPTGVKNFGKAVLYHESYAIQHLVYAMFYSGVEPKTGNTAVVYPIFTLAAYQEQGFYNHYRDTCTVADCLTVEIPATPPTKAAYAASHSAKIILEQMGYTILTDIDVDKNPEILQQYDTIVLLHNEYVTQPIFDAVTAHNNVVYLYPNALMSEVRPDYIANTLTLVSDYRLGDMPSNAFDFDIEMEFRQYEFDRLCLDWEFHKVANGYHLDCYPEFHMLASSNIIRTMADIAGHR